MATDVQLQAIVSLKDEASAKFNKLAGTIAKVAISFATAGLAVKVARDFIVQSIDAAKAEEVAMAKVAAIVKTLKGNLDEHTESIDKASKAAMKLGFDDEDAAIAMAKLMQVTDSSKEANDALAVSMDLARFKGIDLSSAQQAVTMAMGGNVRMLKQLGIDVPDNATKQDVLRLAMEKVGGQAVAYGDTLAGAQEKAKVAFENLQEEVGKIFLPVMANMFSSISSFLTSDRLQGWLTNIKTLFNDQVFPAMKKVGDFITNILWPALRDNITPAWQMAYDAIKPHLPLLQDIAKWIGIIAGGAIVGALIIVSNVIAGIVVGFGKMLDIIKAIVEWIRKLVDAIKSIPDKIGGFGADIKGGWSELGKIITGKAGGGYVSGGTPYMVGERGPELFVPSSSGSIVPNNKMGASVTVNFNNAVVRSDYDLERIIHAVKDSLSRDLSLEQMSVV